MPTATELIFEPTKTEQLHILIALPFIFGKHTTRLERLSVNSSVSKQGHYYTTDSDCFTLYNNAQKTDGLLIYC
jgi:hypothetical protein